MILIAGIVIHVVRYAKSVALISLIFLPRDLSACRVDVILWDW